MNLQEQILRSVEKTGKPVWKILPDLVNDSDFQSLLTNQQNNIIREIVANPNSINSYEHYLPDIIAKYYGWKIYRDSGLKNLEEKVGQIDATVKDAKKEFDDLTKFSGAINGATALTAYANIFDKQANTHKTKAEEQFKNYKFTLAFLLVIIGFIFFMNVVEYDFLKRWLADDIIFRFSLGVFTLKTIILIFLFQISMFFKRNYNAEKHLEEIYLHRSAVLNSLHAVYISIDNKDEKDKILAAGATLAYERGETGYITTKEGAGSNDISLEGVLSRIVTK